MVLGLVSTKWAEIEDGDLLAGRIEEAARYHPKERLGDLDAVRVASAGETAAERRITPEIQEAKLRASPTSRARSGGRGDENLLRGWPVDRDAIAFVGRDLQRPECILAEPDGTLWSADARGGVMRIEPDGTQELVAQEVDTRFADSRVGRAVHDERDASERARVRPRTGTS